jgi:hypothetical protein
MDRLCNLPFVMISYIALVALFKIQERIINYWAKLLTGKQEKILAILYNFSLLNYRTNIPWLKSVKSILDECGLSYVWNNQYFATCPFQLVMYGSCSESTKSYASNV